MSVSATPAVAAKSTADLLPGIIAAVSFSIADILLKVVLSTGMDALSLATLRGVVVVAFFLLWFRLRPPTRQHTSRERVIALGIGLLFSDTMLGEPRRVCRRLIWSDHAAIFGCSIIA
jgi:drug/metabolite transporter (DMT)-like permease